MTDQSDKPKLGTRPPLGLKRTVETGKVKQSFSHGRSNTVVVEVKKRRILGKPGEAPPPRRAQGRSRRPGAGAEAGRARSEARRAQAPGRRHHRPQGNAGAAAARGRRSAHDLARGSAPPRGPLQAGADRGRKAPRRGKPQGRGRSRAPRRRGGCRGRAPRRRGSRAGRRRAGRPKQAERTIASSAAPLRAGPCARSALRRPTPAPIAAASTIAAMPAS